jgi:hypothetical protein
MGFRSKGGKIEFGIGKKEIFFHLFHEVLDKQQNIFVCLFAIHFLVYFLGGGKTSFNNEFVF